MWLFQKKQLSEISQRQRLLGLVDERVIGFSFQLAIIRHQYKTSHGRILPPARG